MSRRKNRNNDITQETERIIRDVYNETVTVHKDNNHYNNFRISHRLTHRRGAYTGDENYDFYRRQARTFSMPNREYDDEQRRQNIASSTKYHKEHYITTELKITDKPCYKAKAIRRKNMFKAKASGKAINKPKRQHKRCK